MSVQICYTIMLVIHLCTSLGLFLHLKCLHKSAQCIPVFNVSSHCLTLSPLAYIYIYFNSEIEYCQGRYTNRMAMRNWK